MGRKDFEDFVSGWFVGEMLAKVGKDDGRGSGCGATLLLGCVLFILYCIYALSGVKFESIWSFLKMITFPVTWDYQLLDFKLFGTNNYYSFVGAIVSFLIIIYGGPFLDKVIIHGLEGTILKKRIGNFQPVRTGIHIVSTIYDFIFLPLMTLYTIVIILKIMLHGFLSILTFLFSL